MAGDRPEHWFPAKRYGWGWGLPRTWQGWAVVVLYCVVVLAATAADGIWTGVVQLVATLLLVLVCLRKGEPARWRWGGR